MATSYGYFDSVNGDRKYNAKTFSTLIGMLITPGIFYSNIGLFKTTASGTNMTVTVGPGESWGNDTWFQSDANTNFTIGAAHASLHRIDRICVRHNLDPNVRRCEFVMLKGVASSNPSPTAPTRTAQIWDWPIADIRVNAGTTKIAQANITNKVGSSESPFIVGINDSIDVDFIFDQTKAEFDVWWNSVKNLLSGDVAGNLSSQISTLSGAVDTVNSTVSTLNDDIVTNKNRLNKITADTGEQGFTYVSNIDNTGINYMRVVNGLLYVQGCFRYNASPPGGETSNTLIANFPAKIKDALSAAGWTSDYVAVGTVICPGSDAAGLIVANNTGIYYGYRTTNPTVGSWNMMTVQGAMGRVTRPQGWLA